VGREPTGGELYAAHFLGPQGSARLIEAVQASPAAIAATLFPDAAASNHGVFYRDGRAVTVSELYANLNQTGGRGEVEMDADPGQTAFAVYASAGRAERLKEQEMMVQFIMSSDDGGKTPLSSLFSADLLTVLANARKGQ
jgi:hypothetical protein